MGDAQLIDAALAETRHNGERIACTTRPTFVGMDEKPAEALGAQAGRLDPRRRPAGGRRRGRRAGLRGQHRRRRAGLRAHFKLIPGVRRAALASVYPTRTRHGEKHDPFSLILDVGATVDATAEDLVAFAVMGSAYARIISQEPAAPRWRCSPTAPRRRRARRGWWRPTRRLVQHPGLNFVGNVEGVDIPKGTADVIVCDGFVGNVCLKMLEGVAETVVELAHYAYKEKLSVARRPGHAQHGHRAAQGGHRLGAVRRRAVLGFDRLFIKAHGRSKARAIANAGKVAAKAVDAPTSPHAIREGLTPAG